MELPRVPFSSGSAIGSELLERFDPMAGLTNKIATAALRIELQFAYDEIATMTERPSRDAARVRFAGPEPAAELWN